MTENITHRQIVYRLPPGSTAKAGRLAGQAGACRFVWNEMLARQKVACDAARVEGEKPPSVTFLSLGKRFAELRREVPWLSDYAFKVTRYTLKYQADAWKAAFRGSGFPRFHSRHNSTPSFAIPEDVKIRDGRIHIPRIAWLTIRRRSGSPYPDSKPVKAVIRKSAGKWHVTICYRVETAGIADNGMAAGVDMNVRQVAVATSDGQAEIIHVPDTGLLDTKIGRVQRRMAKQKKASRRRFRTRIRLQRLQRKRANIRKNWHHQASRQIANRASTVIVEKLNTKGMTRSAKGTVQNPGTNVRAKSGLNREILNTGWHSLKQKLDYKADVTEINPAYTSQTCNACGTIDKSSRKDRKYQCVACGHADHADLNAARNILASGIGATARRGAFASATPRTRETDALAA